MTEPPYSPPRFDEALDQSYARLFVPGVLWVLRIGLSFYSAPWALAGMVLLDIALIAAHLWAADPLQKFFPASIGKRRFRGMLFIGPISLALILLVLDVRKLMR